MFQSAIKMEQKRAQRQKFCTSSSKSKSLDDRSASKDEQISKAQGQNLGKGVEYTQKENK